ncbi:MAG TPA: PilZ domain-containing protein [Bryobacteraceae bacterium]|nr:PilZ domain-containing protein [Bryobacteraceae bacterium]
MEYRAESRFQVSSKLRVIVPAHPPRILDCDLADISATGLRFLSPEEIKAEGIVAVEVDLRLILAEVRHCEPRGLRFVVGVRRLHEIEKNVPLSDPVACVREMIADLHRHISTGSEPDSAILAMRALETILERDGISGEDLAASHLDAAPVAEVVAEAEYWEPPRSQVSAAAPSEAEVIEKSGEESPIEYAPVEPARIKEEIEQTLETLERTDVPRMATSAAPMEEVPTGPEAAPVAESVPKAPARQAPDLLDQIRAAEARKAIELPTKSKRKSRRVPLALAAGLMIAAAVAISVIERHANAHVAPGPVKLVRESRTETAPPPEPPPAVVSPPAEIADAPPLHHARMTMIRTGWVSIVSDTGQPFKGVLKEGQAHDIDFLNAATLWVNKLDAVEIRLDGAPGAPLPRGVRTLELTPHGVKGSNAPPPPPTQK